MAQWLVCVQIGVVIPLPNPIPTVSIFYCFWAPNCVLILGKSIRLRLYKSKNMSKVYMFIIPSVYAKITVLND